MPPPPRGILLGPWSADARAAVAELEEGKVSADEHHLACAGTWTEIPASLEERQRLISSLLESELVLLSAEAEPTPPLVALLRLAALAGLRRALIVTSVAGNAGEIREACAAYSMSVRATTVAELSSEAILEWLAPSTVEPHADAADRFAANLFWFSEEPLHRGREYLVRLARGSVLGSVARLEHRIDTDLPLALSDLREGQAAQINLVLREAVVFPTNPTRTEESFVVMDLASTKVLGAGILSRALFRSTAIQWQPTAITKSDRARGQHPTVVWFTGLPGSGKTTLANLLEADLFGRGIRTAVLDADNVRKGLNKDLGFSDADRVENIRRLAEVAKIVSDAGVLPIVASISPFIAERQAARRLFSEETFLEVFVDAPVDLCRARDPKGIYRMQALGQIQRMTGVNAPYEPPEAPELHLRTDEMDLEACLSAMLACLTKTGLLAGS